MFAGHETTTTFLYWAIYALCIYPDIQERVYEDINSVLFSFSDDDDDIGDTTIIDCIDLIESKMMYCNAFMNEVLRLYPLVGILVRFNRYEENMKGYKIPPKTRFVSRFTFKLNHHNVIQNLRFPAS